MNFTNELSVFIELYRVQSIRQMSNFPIDVSFT